MRAITRRLLTLERAYAPTRLQPFRVVVSACGRPLNLETSTCTRTCHPNGSLIEVVHLDGTDEGLSHEDLERFIARFPIGNAPGVSR